MKLALRDFSLGGRSYSNIPILLFLRSDLRSHYYYYFFIQSNMRIRALLTGQQSLCLEGTWFNAL